MNACQLIFEDEPRGILSYVLKDIDQFLILHFTRRLRYARMASIAKKRARYPAPLSQQRTKMEIHRIIPILYEKDPGGSVRKVTTGSHLGRLPQHHLGDRIQGRNSLALRGLSWQIGA